MPIIPIEPSPHLRASCSSRTVDTRYLFHSLSIQAWLHIGRYIISVRENISPEPDNEDEKERIATVI